MERLFIHINHMNLGQSRSKAFFLQIKKTHEKHPQNTFIVASFIDKLSSENAEQYSTTVYQNGELNPTANILNEQNIHELVNSLIKTGQYEEVIVCLEANLGNPGSEEQSERALRHQANITSDYLIAFTETPKLIELLQHQIDTKDGITFTPNIAIETSKVVNYLKEYIESDKFFIKQSLTSNTSSTSDCTTMNSNKMQTSHDDNHQRIISPQHPLIRPAGTLSPFPWRRDIEIDLCDANTNLDMELNEIDKLASTRLDATLRCRSGSDDSTTHNIHTRLTPTKKAVKSPGLMAFFSCRRKPTVPINEQAPDKAITSPS